MKLQLLILVLAILPTLSAAKDREEERDKKMLELDKICEQARQKKMWPIKLEIFQNCMKEKGKIRSNIKRKEAEASCKKLADEYNGNRAGGHPKFYDLPECEAAHKFRYNTDY